MPTGVALNQAVSSQNRSGTKNGSRTIVRAGVVVFVLCICVGVGLLVWPRLAGRAVTPQNQENQTSLGQFFISGVSNSGAIDLQDLPVFSDVRSVFEHNGKLIVVGFNRVAEFDTSTKEIVRQSDRLRFTTSSAALIGDFLYVAGSVPTTSTQEGVAGKRTLIKVDLASGAIVKDYFSQDERQFTNLSVVGIDRTVWLSSWDGVMSLDTRTESLSSYTAEEVGASSPDCLAGIRDDDGAPTVLLNCGELALSHFQPASKKWQVTPSVSSEEYNHAFYTDPAQYGLTLPRYLFVSSLMGDHAYAFTADAVWKVRAGEFPKRLAAVSLPNADMQSNTAVVGVPADERQLVVVRVSGEFEQLLFVELINPQTGEVKELLDSASTPASGDQPADAQQPENTAGREFWQQNVATLISQHRAAFREENGQLILVDDDGDPLLSVDLATQQLQITQ